MPSEALRAHCVACRASNATASRLNVLEHRVRQTRTQAERIVIAVISARGKRKHCARLLVTDDEVDDEHHGRSIVDSRARLSLEPGRYRSDTINYVWAAFFFNNTMCVIAWYLVFIFLSCFLHLYLKARKMHMVCHCSNEV